MKYTELRKAAEIYGNQLKSTERNQRETKRINGKLRESTESNEDQQKAKGINRLFVKRTIVIGRMCISLLCALQAPVKLPTFAIYSILHPYDAVHGAAPVVQSVQLRQ